MNGAQIGNLLPISADGNYWKDIVNTMYIMTTNTNKYDM